MTSPPVLRIEIDGRTATAEQLLLSPFLTYGHFTAMQVRSGKVRGLDLHLDRLDTATRELFDAGLDRDRIRRHIRHALAGDVTDASVRVYVSRAEAEDRVSAMVTVRPPAEMPGTPQSLRSVPYQRPVPHIKHVGGFGQAHHRLLAGRDGFDEVLLTGPGGVVSEGGITNIAFFDGSAVVWPDAPALRGITMQLLEPRLPGGGLPTRRSPVRLADLDSFGAAFVTNSQGIAPVARIDDLSFPVEGELMKTVTRIYESVPWDPI
ncbi:aminotransferase class IV [Streptosporangium sp. CA-135522]|uniref:aminotransferase class IV n=1 Tax=Streptosporangium sp. CA-135522 TaxID=3240072 RepID=UPI003D8AE0EC